MAIINGPVINKKGLYQNAETKSKRDIETNILVMPQPGHFNFVNSKKIQGILIPVHSTKTK